MRQGSCVRIFKDGFAAVTCIKVNDTLIAAGHKDGILYVYDFKRSISQLKSLKNLYPIKVKDFKNEIRSLNFYDHNDIVVNTGKNTFIWNYFIDEESKFHYGYN